MKTTKKLTLSILFAVLIVLMCGTTAFAATKTKNLKQNVWVSQKYGDEVYYKITVPNNGYLTFTVKNPKKGEYVEIDIYDKNKKYIAEPVWTKEKNATIKYAVKKGTYYLKGGYFDTFQFKYKFTKLVNKNNYTATKAIKLKKNSEVTIVQTPENYYPRWYKITLTKKQPITYWFSGIGSVVIYDSEFNVLDTVYTSNDKYYTYESQKKGTYYVRIIGSTYDIKNAQVCTFKWK